ncbi:hypothetical protein [Legionella londiniensis]|uniref:Uncharacterized protein n=1 Tax=Legionella londiniensis TaxID=45068 RepID=A0A0W0VSL3_9GAMM|nr:hypothetical protein [Legionella londiniensis]KTD23073.1 hypothetical protein Llon_0307 [Legionella londiniensis]STX94090.1 Uncharacterised protein [Legionella londiniensis]
MDRDEFNHIVSLAKSAYEARQKAKEAYEAYAKAATAAYVAKAAQEARRTYEISLNREDFEMALVDKLNHDFNTNFEFNYSDYSDELESERKESSINPDAESEEARLDELDEEETNEPPSLSDLFSQEDEASEEKKEPNE